MENNNCNSISIEGSLEKSKQQTTSAKNKMDLLYIVYFFCGMASLIILIFLCFMMYKNNFSMESLLALLLAFFSIFISIFFYFKASDTSNKFYDNSYNFMKDISVTLGKIEERFGEKLNSLNDKISHVTREKEETSEELKSVESDKQAMIEELLEKAKLDENEKNSIRAKLQEKEKETQELKYNIRRLDRERSSLQMNYKDIDLSSNKNNYTYWSSILENFSRSEIDIIRNCDFDKIPEPFKRKIRENNYFVNLGEYESFKKFLTHMGYSA